MHRQTVAVGCLIVGTGLVLALAQPADDAQKKLQGTWAATAAERDGKPADDVVGNRLTFTGNRFLIRSPDGKTLYEGTFRVDAGAKPAAIDFDHTAGALKGKTWKGIYALDGDTLKECDNAPNPDKGRPAAFEAKAGSGYIAITFKREQAKEPAADERELAQLVKDLNAAVVKADLAFLERVLHPDYTHHRPRGTVETRAQYLENRKASRVKYEAMVSDDIKVRVYGDTAVVTGRTTVKGKDERGAIDDRWLWTRVLVRKDGRWHFVHYQGTPIPKP